MQHLKSISDLTKRTHNKLDDLAERLKQRDAVLKLVRAAVPGTLAAQVATAGFESGRLSVGVTSAAWATRLRYALASARAEIETALGVEIGAIRVRVARPAPPP